MLKILTMFTIILTMVFTKASALHPYYFVIHWSSKTENEIIIDSTSRNSLFNEIFRIECEDDDGDADLKSIKKIIEEFDSNFKIFVDEKIVGVNYSCHTENNFKKWIEKLSSCYSGKYIAQEKLIAMLDEHIFRL